MQTKNPKASLIKKITQFHINDNNFKINSNRNQNFTSKIINNNKFLSKQNIQNNNNYNLIILIITKL